MTTGPYRFLRHPIYAAILFFFAATLVDHFSIGNVMLLVVVAAAVLARALAEEKLLRTRYSEYDDYARRKGRFVPLLW